MVQKRNSRDELLWPLDLDDHGCVHWSQCAHWTLHEAVALSLGGDPIALDKDSLMDCLDVDLPVVWEYRRRTDLVNRAREAGELSDPTPPGRFLKWAKRRALEYPKELEEALEAHGHTLVDGKKELGTRERQSLQKIIYGMAAAKYGYKPNGIKSSAVQNICSDLAEQGVGVGDDTVREVLRAGAELRDRSSE